MKYKVECNFTELLNDCINAWGRESQEDMAIEEMSELIKEICKKRRGRDNQEQLVEEVADVLIMTLQMVQMCGHSQVMDVVSNKLDRLLTKLI